MSVFHNGTLQEVEVAGHVPKFGGEIWYVNKGTGADTNGGHKPDDAFETIGAGITACSAGDAITIKAGTYTETGLDLNLDYVELWCEMGVIIDPASGTALTISGNSCKVMGMHKVTPDSAEIGVLVSGDECHIEHGKVVGGTNGYQVTGTGNMLIDCAAAFQSVISFDIQGTQTRVTSCKTAGNTTSTGYKISGGVDTGVLNGCTSVGHQTSGYYIDTGSSGWTILNCSSGSGDGPKRDIDDVNVWANYRYDDDVSKIITFAGAATTYNIFTITGAVRVIGLFGHVETELPATSSTLYLQAFSSNGTADITDAPGANVQSLPVGAILVRNSNATVAIDIANPAAGPAVAENTSTKDPESIIDVVADIGATTYIRLVISSALASGAIHFHCKYEPLSETGFLIAA